MSVSSEQRDVLEYDVAIVGAGPAGLACALRLKQQAPEMTVCVLEKASQVGAHSLSGAVLQSDALDELVPDWRANPPAVAIPVARDELLWLGSTTRCRLPVPASMRNKGNHIISLGGLCRWLAEKAEQLGVDVLPGFAAAEVLVNDGKVLGVRTGDMGLDKQGKPKASYTPGVDVRAGITVLAEGCRGSLSKQLITRFSLDINSSPQTYGIGFKELWQLSPGRAQPGLVQHTLGWPLSNDVYGGGFIYHLDHDRVAVGFVIGLDYEDPDLQPFELFQQFKHHPTIQPLLAGGEIVSAGTRSLVEGGYQALPTLEMPGAVLIGDAAGMLNVAKIKGTHMALRSGMLAAEHLATNASAAGFDTAWHASPSADELKRVRNIRPGFHFGLWAGMANAALETLTAGRMPWTLRHRDDARSLKARNAEALVHTYPARALAPRDRLSSVYFAATEHDESQPMHLRVADSSLCVERCTQEYGNPCTRFCPAQVYEMADSDRDGAGLLVNSANCLHCKVCDIKDPYGNITWVTPEGGSGPNYQNL